MLVTNFHQCKNIKKLIAVDDRNVGEIAELIGISRNQIYQIYKDEKINEWYVNKFNNIGIDITTILK